MEVADGFNYCIDFCEEGDSGKSDPLTVSINLLLPKYSLPTKSQISLSGF